MPIERTKLTTILRTVIVDYFGDKVVITYRPDVMTPVKQQEMLRARREAEAHEHREPNGREPDQVEEGARNSEELATRLAEVLVSWDVQEEGVDLPPNKENLMTFPNALLVHMSVAIGEDLAPKARTARRS